MDLFPIDVALLGWGVLQVLFMIVFAFFWG